MHRRYLFGPVTAEFADQCLRGPRQAGACLAFDRAGTTDLAIGPADTWDDVRARLPAAWQPDFIALALAYTTVPRCLWSAPLPLVGLAEDWSLLWHQYRHQLRGCDRVVTDPAGVEALARQGIGPAQAANLAGCRRSFLDGPGPDGPRDLDILFVGNLHPAIHRDRLPWLARLARLGQRWRVAIHPRVPPDAYRQLLARARIVFNRSLHGECNRRALEAAAAGAVLFQEAGNRALPELLRDRRECVYYTADDLEGLLEHYLEHEDQRRAMAEAARARVRQASFEALWDGLLERIEPDWPALAARAGRHQAARPPDDLIARYWQALSSTEAADARLVPDLQAALHAQPDSAALHNALGLAISLAASGRDAAPAPAEAAAEHFRRAVAARPNHPVAGLNLAEALARAGRTDQAIDQAQRALAVVEGPDALDPAWLDAGHYPPGFDLFRVEWERAAWGHAGRPAAEARAKRALVRWRLHALLAEPTGDLAHQYEAVLARPDLPASRAALGRALAQGGRPRTAAAHLRRAVEDNPLDRDAARALFEALGAAGDADGQRRLADDRRLLARAAGQVIGPEPWFAAAPAESTAPGAAGSQAGQPRVSLCMIVKDEEANLPACLETVADLVDEIVVVDTGSTDRTKETAARFGARVYDFAWADDFAAARNESLRHATGRWVVWLDADDRLDDDNRRRLRAVFAGLGDEPAVYVMKVRSRVGGPAGSATLMEQARLFPHHPAVRWQYRVHEQILPAVRRLGGAVCFTEVIIDHVGYQDPALRRRKVDRNFRLLQLDDAEHPDDAFTLFNLGWTALDLGRTAEALGLLRRSLERTAPTASTLRKLYALVVEAHRQLGQPAAALAACREGLERCPDDAELLFHRGLLLRDAGDLAGAEASLKRVLETRPGAYFAKVDVGLRGFQTRQILGEIYRDQGRPAEAEAQWRAAVAERPDYPPAWLGLGELALARGRWDELDEVAGRLERRPESAVEGMVLRARGHLARQEFAAARGRLEQAIARAPRAVRPRVILSHVLLQEGQDWAGAERVLRAVLALDPGQAEARHNLAVLLRRPGRPAVT